MRLYLSTPRHSLFTGMMDGAKSRAEKPVLSVVEGCNAFRRMG